MNDKELVRDVKCISCEKMIDCAGHPKNVRLCIQFEERKKDKNVYRAY